MSAIIKVYCAKQMFRETTLGVYKNRVRVTEIFQ